MHPQTLISISTALFLGLMAFAFTNTEAAPVKMQAAKTKPAKSAVPQTARINIVKAVLKPARTKGKLTLQVTLHNPTATRATAFTLQALHQRRVVGKTNINGLNPRARISRTLRNLPRQKGQRCVTVRLTKPRNSKLKLGTSRRVCLTLSMVIRGKKTVVVTPKSRKTIVTKSVTRGRTTARLQAKKKRIGIKGTQLKPGLKYALNSPLLLVDGQVGPVVLYAGIPSIVTWNFEGANNPNTGIYLLISDVSKTEGKCGDAAPYLSTSLGSNDEGYKAHLPGKTRGAYRLTDYSNIVPDKTYWIKGCVWNSGAPTQYTGEETNAVEVRILGVPPEGQRPDLIVSDIFLRGSQVFLKIKNVGGPKPAGLLAYYQASAQIFGDRFTQDTRVSDTITQAMAAGEEITVGTRLRPVLPPWSVEASIRSTWNPHNPNSTARDSHERREPWSELQPSAGSANAAELFIQSATFHLGNGSPADPPYTIIKIRNMGQQAATNFKVSMQVHWLHKGNGPGGVFIIIKRIDEHIDRLNPGTSKFIKIIYPGDNISVFDIYSSPMFISGFVDTFNNVQERYEHNNWQLITSR